MSARVKARARIITRQMADHDCGVAVLSTFLSIPYGDVYVAGAIVAPGFARNGGLSIDQMLKMARMYRRPMERVHWRKVNLSTDCGILGVNWDKSQWKKHGAAGHWVILSRGTVIDPSDLSYDLAVDYLTKYKGRAGTLLREK